MVSRLLICLFILLFAAPAPAARRKPDPKSAPEPVQPAPPKPSKRVTTGVYRDAQGARHNWRITQGHVLVWDEAPYLPVGGTFVPRIWAGPNTADNWKADVAALEALKAHEVTDVILSAGDTGLTHLPPRTVQKVLDYLDANGFRYGIEVADFPRNALTGYVVKPSLYRDPAPNYRTPTRFQQIPGLTSALYFLVSADDGQVIESGDAAINGDDASAVTTSTLTGTVLLLYPQRRFSAGTLEHRLPDLWQGFDRYRDHLLWFFRQVRLGKGFRFFLDPLSSQMDIAGDAINVIPTSQEFHLDFEAWLDRKYQQNVDDLNHGWGIVDRTMPDFETAARCIPLWYQSKGLPILYDPAKKATYAIVKTATRGRFWEDYAQFRAESVRSYLSAVSTVLKKSVADVPVICKWSQAQDFWSLERSRSGIDGFGIETYGAGRELVQGPTGYAYAQAAEAPRTTWLIVSGTQTDADPKRKAEPGYHSKADLFNDWDTLRDSGARGIFTQALQRLPEETYAPVNLALLPDQLDWMADYARSLSLDAGRLGEEKLAVLWYPSGAAPPGGIRQFRNGVWWMPTSKPGSAVDLGPHLEGYKIDGDDPTPTYVIWSPGGALQEAQFFLGKQAEPEVTDAAGTPLKPVKRKDVWVIPVGADPVVVRGVPLLPMAVDALEIQVREARRLIKLADSEKVPAQKFKDQLSYAATIGANAKEAEDTRYKMVTQVVNELTERLRPYAWIEGESASSYTFDSIVTEPGVSGGAYLSLDSDRTPPASGEQTGYRAVYKFTLNAPGRYELWLAGSPIGDPDTSPVRYQIDDGTERDARAVATPEGRYLGKFLWSDLGDMTLSGGAHTLTIIAADRRASDKRYALTLDAICLTRTRFRPDGASKPEIEAP